MSRDLIASTTIARLYLAQGHHRKAGRVLTTLIDQDPTDGAALHLRERLALTQGPLLTASVDEVELTASWERVGRDVPRYVIVTSFLSAGTHPRVGVTSVHCKESAGTCSFQRSALAGSAVLTVGFVGERGFVAEAVTSPLVWSRAESP